MTNRAEAKAGQGTMGESQRAALEFANEALERHPCACAVVLLIEGDGEIGMGLMRRGDVGDAEIVFALEGLKSRILARAFGGGAS